MTTIGDLRAALDEIPAPLLGEEDAQVLKETRTSLEALESLDIVPTVVVFVGSSGSGKSSLVNAALGVSAVDTGPLRPTTDRIVMVGSSGPVSLSAESEYLHVPSVRPGLLVIDTPPWEHDPDGVASAVAAADLLAVVVTPSRYGDETVARLVETFEGAAPSVVILNRVAVTPDDRDRLVAAVTTRFGVEPMVIDEGSSLAPAGAELVDRLRVDSVEYQRSAVLRSAAASGSAYLAGRIGQAVVDLRRLSAAIQRAGDRTPSGRRVLPVSDTWEQTHRLLVRAVVDELGAVDDAVSADGGSLALRVRAHLPTVDEAAIAQAVDAWRSETTASFVSAATIRWRRASAERLIAANAWRVSLADSIAVPRRFRRLVGSEMHATAVDARHRLERFIDESVDGRIEAWATATAQLGDYAPGALLAAAEDFDRARPVDG